MGLFSTEINPKTMVPICRQLATSYGAGIPITQSLEHVGAVVKDGAAKRVLRDMGDDLRQGSTLAEAASSQSKFLPTFFIQLLASGEAGGRLDIMLQDLAQYYEDRLDMRRKISGLMAYPMIQVAFAWIFGTFALGVMAGAAEHGGGLSGVTAYFHDYLWFQGKAMAALVLAGGVAVVLARKGLLAWVVGAVSTHVWPLSNVTRKFALARFFRSFSLLIASGLPITRCIENAAAVSSNPYIERELVTAIPRVKEGATLTQAFSKVSYLTPLAREMLHVGELSGNIEEQSKKISEYHMAEATQAVTIATKALSVFILIAMALLVGTIIIRFYMSFYGGILDELGV